MPGSKGFQITGSVGNVMQENRLTRPFLTSLKAEKLGLEPDFFENPISTCIYLLEHNPKMVPPPAWLLPQPWFPWSLVALFVRMSV